MDDIFTPEQLDEIESQILINGQCFLRVFVDNSKPDDPIQFEVVTLLEQTPKTEH